MRSSNENLAIIAGSKGIQSDAQYLQFIADAVASFSGGGGGGGAPSGPAGGVLGGTYPNPTFGTFTSATLASAVSDETGSGSVVFATSPTFVTPLLGTPTSGVLTNCTGTAAGLTAGNVNTNANLTGPITSTGNATAVASQTGTGTKFVMDTSPTLVTPLLGTPTSGVLTNCTGTASGLTSGNVTTNANLTGVITSVGNATSIASQTGTGTKFVVDTSPTLVTPLLGTPTSGNLANCTFPTLNQNTTGSAASLSISGQTGLLTVTGLTGTNRIKTVRDAADTLLELGGSYTPTGTWTNLTMVTPVLGTPSSGNISNCTGNKGGWTVVTTADVTITSQSITDWSSAVVTGTLTASTTYEVEAQLIVTNAGDTAGMKVAFTSASATNAVWVALGTTVSGTTASATQAFGTASGAFNTTSSGVAYIKMHGMCTTTTGSPTISLQGAKITSGTVTLKAGSVLKVRISGQ